MASPIPLFLAASSSARTIQKFTLGAWDPAVTIRQLGIHIMGPDVGMLRAEASATIDGAEASIWTGTFLDYTVDFAVNTAKLLYIKCIFALEDTLPPPRPASNPFDAMMADPRRRSLLYWPNPYAESKNKATIRAIANGIIMAGSRDKEQHGGFSSVEAADAAKSCFWVLAEVLFAAAPHAGPLQSRSMGIPTLFRGLAEANWVENESTRADKWTQEAIGDLVVKLEHVLEQSPIMSPSFKMSVAIDELTRNLIRYREYLLKQAPRMIVQREQEEPVAADLDYKRINRRAHDLVPTTDMAATILRVCEALSAAELYEPVRVDTLLLTDSEKSNLKYPRTVKARRLKYLLNVVSSC